MVLHRMIPIANAYHFLLFLGLHAVNRAPCDQFCKLHDYYGTQPQSSVCLAMDNQDWKRLGLPSVIADAVRKALAEGSSPRENETSRPQLSGMSLSKPKNKRAVVPKSKPVKKAEKPVIAVMDASGEDDDAWGDMDLDLDGDFRDFEESSTQATPVPPATVSSVAASAPRVAHQSPNTKAKPAKTKATTEASAPPKKAPVAVAAVVEDE